MNHLEAGKYWEDNAEAWTFLAREGYDIYRDHLNTPAFFAILPNIDGLVGIDIGCGEGYNTGLLAQRCAQITGVDISKTFIEKANEWKSQPNIHYQIASAVSLPFQSHQFDFATSFMCFMDVPETEAAITEAFRVLKPGGFLQFSITHPCFDTPHRKNKRNIDGHTYAVEIGKYFTPYDGLIDEWIFGAAPESVISSVKKFKTPKFYRTLSGWVNMICKSGFIIEEMCEPYPSDQIVAQYPKLQDSQVVAYFLIIRCRKPIETEK